MKNFGKKGLDDLITKRHDLAVYLEDKLRKDQDFKVLNHVEINSVAFFYIGETDLNIAKINQINRKIHEIVLNQGKFHLHQFSILDNGLFKKDEVVYPLRFMCGNPNVTHKDVDSMVEYVRSIGKKVESKQRHERKK